jgi:predicted metal-dependent phosphotriesterase family hydrolase
MRLGSAAMTEAQTVRGRVPADQLGVTLPHEHTGIALWHIPGRWDYWELTPDEELIAQELREYSSRGGRTLVDLTLPGVGRDAERLSRLSEATGLHIVMGCGWYRDAYYPPEARVDRRSVDDLADELVAEFEEGVGGSGIRPGIIGEIGTDKPWLSAQEERVHRAAARAARRTGMAVTTHAVMSAVGLAQLDIFEEEGLDPARVIIGHADSYPTLEHQLAIVERGACVEYDFLGMRFTPTEEYGEPRTIRLVQELLERGHGDRLLLSQDVCHNGQLKAYGGRGYSYLAETFLPRLQQAGIPEEAIRRMTVDTPARLLALADA